MRFDPHPWLVGALGAWVVTASLASCSATEREALVVEAGRVVCCTIATTEGEHEVCAKAGDLAQALLDAQREREGARDAGSD